MKDGRTTPSVSRNEPRMPPCVEPTNVSILTSSGPGVDSETAMKFKNSLSVSRTFEMTVSLTRETILYPPPNVKASIFKKGKKQSPFFSHCRTACLFRKIKSITIPRVPQAIMIPYQAIFGPSIPKRFSIAYRFNSLFPRFSQSTRSIR